MDSTEKAIEFWKKIDSHFHTSEIERWIKLLEDGKGDWFRNYGFLNITLSNQCRIGRIGFDEKKYAELQKWANGILNHFGLKAETMQN